MRKVWRAAAAAVFLFGAGAVTGLAVPAEAAYVPAAGYAAEAAQSAEMIQADGYGAVPAGMPAARGRLMARRAAIVDAQRSLVEQIKGTAVDANTTMENYLITSDVVKTKVQGMVTGARILSEEVTSDGAYHVVMAVPMYGVGSVADAAITAVTGGAAAVPMAQPSPSYAAPAAGTPAIAGPTAGTTEGYTGLVIDAKGMPLERTFCPGIFDTNGRAIYGVHNVDPQYAMTKGVAAYAQGAEAWDAAEGGQSRAGSRPLVIKAAALQERTKHKCDILVTPEDGDRILAENQKSHFGDRYAVVLEY